MELKKYLVVKDHDGKFLIWTRKEYIDYIAQCFEVGAAPAFGIVAHFEGTENLLSHSSVLSEGELWRKVYKEIEEDRTSREPLISLLVRLEGKYSIRLRSEPTDAVEFGDYIIDNGYIPSDLRKGFWSKIGGPANTLSSNELYQLFLDSK